MESKHQSASLLGPRRKMRKGTRSCTECRRRKVRCTFGDKPGICNECLLSGLACVDQEHSQLETGGSVYRKGESISSFRGRLSQVENTVNQILKKLAEGSTAESVLSPSLPEEHSKKAIDVLRSSRTSSFSTETPFSVEPEIAPVDAQIGHAPIFQLFDNDMLSRHVETTQSTDYRLSGRKDISHKVVSARASLMSLLPPGEDLAKIISASKMWWTNWQNSFPEICEECRQIFVTGSSRKALMTPVDVAQMLLCLCISIDQLPRAFDFTTLRVPLNPQEFTERCITEIERVVLHDDTFTATLHGIECQLLLSRLHLNQGRPKKCWLSNRRAIQFAQLAGLHLSTAKPPRPDDTLFGRRIMIWCGLVNADRFLSFILGLPYAVPDSAFIPQIELRQKLDGSLPQNHQAHLSVIFGKLIDRNQDPENLSLPATLRLDQDLEDMAQRLPADWWDLELGEHGTEGDHLSRVMVQITHHMIRAILHMPFMLKSATDLSGQFQYCHVTALKSARRSLNLFKLLRAKTRPFLCKLFDLLAFMMALLLVMSLLQRHINSRLSPNLYKADEKLDWDLVRETTEILRRGANETGGTVAAESANILSEICAFVLDDCDNLLKGKTCKITVPYFGTITVGPGKKYSDFLNSQGSNYQNDTNAKTANKTPAQPNTLPLSNSRDPSTARTNSIIEDLAEPADHAAYSDDTWIQLENVLVLPNTGYDFGVTPSLFDCPGQQSWPNLDPDLALDQCWNLDWFDERTQ
ncbi:hypothetical protein V1520DRAFT_340963 [Lipomyces starkeyi]|uniref:Zn(2)-C6 fungal-type domain-containing protein n=1 Tax=Lipomyces starkeyi NRRL Y-11557 TaxID=675824 RepID=A0A1E3PYH4_LIPST|nr:hypothetical protein LIPSTDRAFT_5961 [Lipomyces starkeyi NRRL Y-11557]